MGGGGWRGGYKNLLRPVCIKAKFRGVPSMLFILIYLLPTTSKSKTKVHSASQLCHQRPIRGEVWSFVGWRLEKALPSAKSLQWCSGMLFQYTSYHLSCPCSDRRCVFQSITSCGLWTLCHWKLKLELPWTWKGAGALRLKLPWEQSMNRA